MTHLTPNELVDSLDRPLAAARQAHLEACAACGSERDALRAMVRDVEAVEMPEPSPLFWDHLSARVRERIASEPPPPAASDWLAGLWPRRAFAVALVTLCAMAAALVWTTGRVDREELAPGGRRVAAVDAGTTPMREAAARVAGAGRRSADRAGDDRLAAAAPPVRDASNLAGDDPAGRAVAADDHMTAGELPDDEWALMVDMAEAVAWDEGERPSIDVRPATVERAWTELSSDERRSLVRLLHAELARPSS